MRVRALVLAIAAVAALLGGPDGAPVAAAPAGTVRAVGSGPLDDVLRWAAEERRCGLTTNKLAALMLAPTYPETGTPLGAAPSPMTLSRWDAQRGLHSFGTVDGQPRAFWHPGIGMWQYDAAGLGASYTAAQLIDTNVVAARTAAVIAGRWCAKAGLANAWVPWHACRDGACRTIFRSIYRVDGDRLVGVGRDSTVTRRGGMTRHTCDGPGRTKPSTCWRVDPARAQGYKGFTAAAYGPAPLSAPFYVYRASGREYRFWLPEDTGHHRGVWAERPLGANARTSLAWHRGTPLSVS
jgi:hypothetical protein